MDIDDNTAVGNFVPRVNTELLGGNEQGKKGLMRRMLSVVISWDPYSLIG